MPERAVLCGGVPGRKVPDVLQLDVNAPSGSPKRVNLRIADVSGQLANNIPDALADLIEIAAYVFCADQFTKRGSMQMTDMGAQWRRRFCFTIPVRERNLWSKASIRDALIETLSF